MAERRRWHESRVAERRFAWHGILTAAVWWAKARRNYMVEWCTKNSACLDCLLRWQNIIIIIIFVVLIKLFKSTKLYNITPYNLQTAASKIRQKTRKFSSLLCTLLNSLASVRSNCWKPHFLKKATKKKQQKSEWLSGEKRLKRRHRFAECRAANWLWLAERQVSWNIWWKVSVVPEKTELLVIRRRWSRVSGAAAAAGMKTSQLKCRVN